MSIFSRDVFGREQRIMMRRAEKAFERRAKKWAKEQGNINLWWGYSEKFRIPDPDPDYALLTEASKQLAASSQATMEEIVAKYIEGESHE